MPPNDASPGSGRLALVAWACYDWASSAFATIIQTFVFAAYFVRHVAPSEAVGSAQWGTALGLTGLAVGLCGPAVGALADQGGRRKPWIAGFTLACVAATASLWFVRPGADRVWPALVLIGIATLSAECAGIFYNAMLPALAPPERIGRWSGYGWALGYAGGLVSLLVALRVFVEPAAPVLGLDPRAMEHVRATFPFTAVWFAVFALPLLALTPDTRGAGQGFGRALRQSLTHLRLSLRWVCRYPELVRFLLARMLYTDGLVTLFAFGGVFAAGTLGMDEAAVVKLGIGLNLTAGIGAAGFAWVDDRLGSRRTIFISLGFLLVLTTCALLASTRASFWMFALLLGVFVGPVQAASRSMMARVAPPRARNYLFGLYALSGKATSFLGPLAVGWATLAAGSQRMGMAVIVVLLAAGLGLVASLPASFGQQRLGRGSR